MVRRLEVLGKHIGRVKGKAPWRNAPGDVVSPEMARACAVMEGLRRIWQAAEDDRARELYARFVAARSRVRGIDAKERWESFLQHMNEQCAEPPAVLIKKMRATPNRQVYVVWVRQWVCSYTLQGLSGMTTGWRILFL